MNYGYCLGVDNIVAHYDGMRTEISLVIYALDYLIEMIMELNDGIFKQFLT